MHLSKRHLSVAFAALTVGTSARVVASAQQPPADPLIKERAIAKVSDHVYVISDLNVGLVPNVGIIVGTKATLVVDTGLGPRSSVKAWLAEFQVKYSEWTAPARVALIARTAYTETP